MVGLQNPYVELCLVHTSVFPLYFKHFFFSAMTVELRRKLVLVEDGACRLINLLQNRISYWFTFLGGKTSLLIVFTKDEFPEKYVPTGLRTTLLTSRLKESK